MTQLCAKGGEGSRASVATYLPPPVKENGNKTHCCGESKPNHLVFSGLFGPVYSEHFFSLLSSCVDVLFRHRLKRCASGGTYVDSSPFRSCAGGVLDWVDDGDERAGIVQHTTVVRLNKATLLNFNYHSKPPKPPFNVVCSFIPVELPKRRFFNVRRNLIENSQNAAFLMSVESCVFEQH